jgi:hypothetical protein
MRHRDRRLRESKVFEVVMNLMKFLKLCLVVYVKEKSKATQVLSNSTKSRATQILSNSTKTKAI